MVGAVAGEGECKGSGPHPAVCKMARRWTRLLSFAAFVGGVVALHYFPKHRYILLNHPPPPLPLPIPQPLLSLTLLTFAPPPCPPPARHLPFAPPFSVSCLLFCSAVYPPAKDNGAFVAILRTVGSQPQRTCKSKSRTPAGSSVTADISQLVSLYIQEIFSCGTFGNSCDSRPFLMRLWLQLKLCHLFQDEVISNAFGHVLMLDCLKWLHVLKNCPILSDAALWLSNG